MRRTVYILFSATLLFAAFVHPYAKAASEPTVSARSACVLEQTTNAVLYSKNAHEKLPMASTTKVMTALVAIEQGNLDEIVTTADEAYGVEGSSIYLKLNEQISLSDLLYGLMLRSGNDAAVAIAIHIGGSIDGFCSLMNGKAKEIGAVNTHFANPNGLPHNDHYTTAYDLALICSYALSNNTFREIVSTQYHTTQSGEVKRTMMNKNKLLSQYDGAIGIKTGYTKEAGKCLTFAAERNGLTVVGAELNCPNMFPDSMTLMDHCFNEYEMYTVVRKGTTVMRALVEDSSTPAVLITENDINVPVKKSDGIKLTTHITIKNKLKAPLKSGTYVGKLELYSGTTFVASANIVLRDDIDAYGFYHYMRNVIERFAA